MRYVDIRRLKVNSEECANRDTLFGLLAFKVLSLSLLLHPCRVVFVAKVNADFDVCWTMHHCDNLRIKNQLDVTYYFIVLLIGSTCFGH